MHAHQHPTPTDPRVGPAIVYLIVGLPGAGKTTRAKQLEVNAPALRLTPDEWQIVLFGDQAAGYCPRPVVLRVRGRP